MEEEIPVAVHPQGEVMAICGDISWAAGMHQSFERLPFFQQNYSICYTGDRLAGFDLP